MSIEAVKRLFQANKEHILSLSRQKEISFFYSRHFLRCWGKEILGRDVNCKLDTQFRMKYATHQASSQNTHLNSRTQECLIVFKGELRDHNGYQSGLKTSDLDTSWELWNKQLLFIFILQSQQQENFFTQRELIKWKRNPSEMNWKTDWKTRTVDVDNSPQWWIQP